jgi:anti-anti-sigma regulatory factor
MLRIVPLPGSQVGAGLRVEGELRDAWVPLLQEECDRSLAGSDGQLALDLKDVTYVDMAGRSLLRSLRNTGVRLLNCPPLIEALLEDSAP